MLARKGMIDVIVVSGLSRLSYCTEEILQTMEMLQSFQVQIDCIGCLLYTSDLENIDVKSYRNCISVLFQDFLKYEL